MNRSVLLLAGLAVFQIALFVLSFPGHELNVDEAWIGEQAWFTAHEGSPRSNLFLGHAGLGERVVLYHSLWVRLGSLVVLGAGWSLGNLRMLSLGAATLLFLLVGVYARRGLGYSRTATLATLVTLSFIPLIFDYAKIYRPEVLVAALGFASFLFLLRAESRSSRAWSAVAGLLAGLAALAHMNGAIFVVAGLALLLFRLRWRSALVFALAAVAVCLPYAVEVAGHWELFQTQTQSDLVASKIEGAFSPLRNLLNEHKRMFRKPEILFTTALFLAAVIPGFRTRVRRFPLRYIYLGLVLTGLGCVAAKTLKYAILIFPFFALEFGRVADEVLARFMEDKPSGEPAGEHRILRGVRRSVPVFLVLFLGYGLIHEVRQVAAPRTYLAARHRPLGAVIPEGSLVLGPMELVFDEIEHLRVVSLFAARNETHGELGTAELLDFAESRNVEFLVLDDFWRAEVFDLEREWPRVTERFAPQERVGQYQILRRRDATGSGHTTPQP